jgi:hypothetical protein
VLTVIVTITARSKCTANSYCVLTVIVTITGRFICSANSYCDNNGDKYMQY